MYVLSVYHIYCSSGSEHQWNPHKVEMALWAHFVVGELKKELLDGMPGGGSVTPAPSSAQQPAENGDTQSQSPQKAKNVRSYMTLFRI